MGIQVGLDYALDSWPICRNADGSDVCSSSQQAAPAPSRPRQSKGIPRAQGFPHSTLAGTQDKLGRSSFVTAPAVLSQLSGVQESLTGVFLDRCPESMLSGCASRKAFGTPGGDLSADQPAHSCTGLHHGFRKAVVFRVGSQQPDAEGNSPPPLVLLFWPVSIRQPLSRAPSALLATFFCSFLFGL